MAVLKTLKVCLSNELPLLSDRDPDIIYFLYDKLTIFIGQNMYYDPYAIVETVPENPVTGILYFTLDDGKVRVYVDYEMVEIAKIENKEQLEILKQSGSTFFINSKRRYLDLNRRIVTLPFQNGTYELTVSLANDLIIDKDTVIGFNPETNMFEIIGDKYDHDLLFIKDYYGENTSTIETKIDDGHRIISEAKISKGYNNIIKIVNDGLYADISDRVSKEEFDNLVVSYKEYKTYMEHYLNCLQSKIDDGIKIISPESISKRILEALENVYPEINDTLESFDKLYAQFEGIERRSKIYADEKYQDAYNELREVVLDISNNVWEDFGSETTSKENT